VLGTIDAVEGSPGSTETIGADEGIAAIVRGKLHLREGIGADAKNPGGGAIKKPDAYCISEELARRTGSAATGMFAVRREED
jgi:hypothetical protein